MKRLAMILLLAGCATASADAERFVFVGEASGRDTAPHWRHERQGEFDRTTCQAIARAFEETWRNLGAKEVTTRCTPTLPGKPA